MNSPIRQLLNERILVLDGAMGTAVQNLNLTAEQFGGASLEGCIDNLIRSCPKGLEQIHESHLKAGCDIIETNTFGATPLVLDEYQIGDKAYEINLESAKLAKTLAKNYSTPAKPRFVAGSMGPTTKAISVTGGITFEQLIDHFYTQAKGLSDGGVDYLLLETCQDLRNIKAGLLAIDRVNEERKNKNISPLETAVSVTIEAMGTLLGGQSAEAVYASLAHRDLLYLGLNCATGPEFMTDHVRTLSALSHFPLACIPNAGLPDEEGIYLETPDMMASILSRFVKNGWVNLIGGCCGTTSEHIGVFSKLVQNEKPRNIVTQKRHMISGIDYLEITNELSPVIVGERTNVIGSRKFKKLICDEKFEEASEIAKAQVKKGAQIIDICLANPDRSEFDDMRNFLEFVVKKVRAPLMIDSTDEKVIEMALTYSQGKVIINSINLEDGEERFEKVIPIAQKLGAAFVVGTIDDDPKQGMGITRERKVEIAQRSYDLLTKKYHVPAEDIYWDPLVFPCGTGDQQYVGSAAETIEGIREIKKRFPRTKTILGISNVSFGLPAAGREVLNTVFLHDCVKAGLDLAIVNSQKLQRYGSLPADEVRLSEDLLYNRGADPIGSFANHFRKAKPKVLKNKNEIPLAQRLSSYIIEGSKDGLFEDLNLALKDQKPLEIVNGPLMAGMDEVGRLFNNNELIVAEVLQSAEAMKASVAHLEPFMEKKDMASKGKVLLATVKGDVHDIGKNLVEIILSNNGFKVINLGIKVPPEVLIKSAREHKPDIIGLSGLLVKSAQQMVLTADDFSKAGIFVPVLVGGAALSSKFVDRKISKAYKGTVIYASDAMHGLELSKIITNATSFKKLQSELVERRKNISEPIKKAPPPGFNEQKQSSQVKILDKIPEPSDYKRHVLKWTPIDHIFSFINPLMLYTRHLGLKGPLAKKINDLDKHPEHRAELEKTEPKALNIYDKVKEVKEEFRRKEELKPMAVFQFFKAQKENNNLLIFANPEDKKPAVTFNFPRQKTDPFLCLSDYTHPTQPDSVAFFVTTVGTHMHETAEKLKDRGDYLKSHVLQALALESAEAYAELLHKQIRKAWGIVDDENLTMEQVFQARYQGKRYSFGYPACPALEDQRKLFKLLKPADIGIELTEEDMMDPEASVSALAFHHPEAKYFTTL